MKLKLSTGTRSSSRHDAHGYTKSELDQLRSLHYKDLPQRVTGVSKKPVGKKTTNTTGKRIDKRTVVLIVILLAAVSWITFFFLKS